MHTDSLEIELEGEVTANGDAAQVYFNKEYTQQPIFPLEPGTEFRAHIVPGRAIVLLPGTPDREYPLEVTLHNPDSYRLTIESDPEPDSESMHTTTPDSDDADPRGESP